MDELTEMHARLRRIFRGEEQYCPGRPAEQARQFRLAELLPITIAHAVRNSAGDLPRGPVDLLVSLSGFSPETTILAFELIKPKRLMIIGSESTRASIDVILEKIDLPVSRTYIEDCDPTNPMGIYQAVQKAARMVPRQAGPDRVIIDITGGKKVMSASAALAAAQLDLPLCYVDSTFDPELRQSQPGTERLVIVPNPTALFGDRELDDARIAFRHGAYAAAHDRFSKVADAAYEPAHARFLRDLSAVYRAWCDLDFPSLREHAAVLRARLADPGHRPDAGIVSRLHEQLDFVESLVRLHDSEAEGPPFILNFYLLGEHYHGIDRFDFAALLYYRTIESAFANRLVRRAPGFTTGKPDYSLLSPDVAQLTTHYTTIAERVHGHPFTALPHRIGLIDAALLLLALDDPMLGLLHMDRPSGFGRLTGLVGARNRSVLAPGTTSVNSKLARRLADLALLAISAFWQLESDGGAVEERIDRLRFLAEA